MTFTEYDGECVNCGMLHTTTDGRHCRFCGEPWNTRDIHPAVEVQQERVASLRGLCGQLAAALRDIRDNAAPGTAVHAIAEQALAQYREAA